MTSRPAIPSEIKREVRKRCGFGCVICGLPIYEYDHIQEFNEVKEHKTENLTLLCDRHHKEKTNGLLPVRIIHQANKNPFNLKKNCSTQFKCWNYGYLPTVVIGGNRFTLASSGGWILRIDGHDLISLEFKENRLWLSVDINTPEGFPLLQIRDNELTHSLDEWDYEFVGSRLVIRRKKREVLLDVSFQPNESLVIFKRGTFVHNGTGVVFNEKGLVELVDPERPAMISLSNLDIVGTRGGLELGDPKYETRGHAFGLRCQRRPFDMQASIERSWKLLRKL